MKQLKIAQQITNRESQSLDKYFQELNKLEMITSEMEVKLAERIRAGDSAALDKLTKANLRFVVSVAKQYQNFGLSLGDLINEGNLGLIKAAMRFDEKRGFKFISYAVWWVRQSILQALAEQARIVRLPLNRVGALTKIFRSSSMLEQQLQREPSAEELAENMGMSLEEVKTSISVSTRHVSFDAPSSQESDASLHDMLSGDKTTDEELMIDSLQQEIGRALRTLSLRESDIICYYYGLNGNNAMTLDEIGHMFNLTRERVRQIKEKATNRLKHASVSHALRAYLG